MIYSIILFVGVGLNILAQIFLKKTMVGHQFSLASFGPNLMSMVAYPMLWLSLFLYGGGFVAYAIALTKLELSRAYPIASISAVIIIFVISTISLNESLTVFKTLGLIFSVLGIFLLFK